MVFAGCFNCWRSSIYNNAINPIFYEPLGVCAKMIYKGYFSMSLVDAVLNCYISLQADSPGSLISH